MDDDEILCYYFTKRYNNNSKAKQMWRWLSTKLQLATAISFDYQQYHSHRFHNRTLYDVDLGSSHNM